MRFRVVLGLGLPIAGLAVFATLAGPDRLRNLTCRAGLCDEIAEVQQLCRAAERTAATPDPERAQAMRARLDDSWASPGAVTLLDAIEAAPAGGAYDVILDVVESSSADQFFCPALTEVYAAPVALTPERVVVHGRTLLRLRQGRLPDDAVDASGLAIEGLRKALGYTADGSPMRVASAPGLPSETLLRVAYSLGLASVPRLHLTVPGQAGPVRLDLPAHGRCADCLADIPEVRWLPGSSPHRILLGVVGRRAEQAEAVPDGPLAMLTLPKSGGYRWAPEGRTPAIFHADLSSLGDGASSGRTLVVVADHDRPVVDLATAIARVQGPTDRPRVDSTVLGLPRRVLRQEARLDELIQAPGRAELATQQGLLAAAEGLPATDTSREWIRASNSGSQRARSLTRATARRSVRRGTDAQIARSVRPKLKTLRSCYERALKIDTFLAGKVVLHFDVGDSGRAQNVRLVDHTLGSSQVTECIARRARHWRLPAPANGPVSVTYPLVFAPAAI